MLKWHPSDAVKNEIMKELDHITHSEIKTLSQLGDSLAEKETILKRL